MNALAIIQITQSMQIMQRASKTVKLTGIYAVNPIQLYVNHKSRP